MSNGNSQSTKPHLTIGTIGAPEHGKTALTAAITKVLALRRWADFRRVDQLGSAPEEKTRGFTTVKYESESRQYTHIDFANHNSYLKNIIIGAAQLDGAILVVDAEQGPMPQTHEQVRLARQASVPALVVFHNKVDTAHETAIESSELDLRELLTDHGFPGHNMPIICGSALRVLACASSDPNAKEYACVWHLLRAVDASIPTPTPLADRPFLMPIEEVFNIKERGTVANGRIERGQVKVGDEIGIVGLRSTRKSAVVGMEMLRKLIDRGVAGDTVGCVLRGISTHAIERGIVLAKPGTITPSMAFAAEFYVFTREEGGRHTPFFSRRPFECSLRTATIAGTAQLPDGIDRVMPGNHTQLSIQLVSPVALATGDRFTLREGGVTVGAGIISKL